MLSEPGKIKFAIPSKGRLKDPTIELLKKSGYSFRSNGRNLYATCTNADIIFIFIRADDIPVLVDSGVVDMGITGSDLIIERNSSVDVLLPLDYGKCKLSVAIQDNFNPTNLKDFNGKSIATSFPVITSKFFSDNKIDINVIEMNGSVEIMVGLKLADAIVDLVETGDTLRENNLKVYTDIGNYQSVLITNKKLKDNPAIAQIKRRVEGILIAERYSILEYNVKNELIKEIEKITPGFESPTISPLDEPGWVAVKVMVEKKKVISVMDDLEKIGATAIIETEIKNCRL